MLTQLRARKAAPSFCTRASAILSTGPKAAKSTSGQGGSSAPKGGRTLLMLEFARSCNFRKNGTDGISLAGLGDDRELAARRRLDLLDRFVALEGVQRLTFGYDAAIGYQPFRQDTLVHREANLRHQYLRAHFDPSVAVVELFQGPAHCRFDLRLARGKRSFQYLGKRHCGEIGAHPFDAGRQLSEQRIVDLCGDFGADAERL